MYERVLSDVCGQTFFLWGFMKFDMYLIFLVNAVLPLCAFYCMVKDVFKNVYMFVLVICGGEYEITS